MKIRAFVASAIARWCPLSESVRISTRSFYRKGKTYPGLWEKVFWNFLAAFFTQNLLPDLRPSVSGENGEKTSGQRILDPYRPFGVTNQSINQSLVRICPWVYWLLQQNMERSFAQVVITKWPFSIWLTNDNLHSAKNVTHIRFFGPLEILARIGPFLTFWVLRLGHSVQKMWIFELGVFIGQHSPVTGDANLKSFTIVCRRPIQTSD